MGNENSGREVYVWTDEKVAQLTELWNVTGLSAVEIAARLGLVSRSAVLGKARRIGLAKRRGVTPRIPHPDSLKPKRPPRAVPAGARQHRPKPEVPFKPQGSAWEPVPGVVPLPLLDLKSGQCKWPVSQDAPFLFCAAPVEPGAPYCPHHVLWSIGQGTMSERSAIAFAARQSRREQEEAA